MLCKDKEMVGRSVPGKLKYTLPGTPDLFSGTNPEIERLRTELAQAQVRLDSQQREHILPVFREIVADYIREYKEKPTSILMSYHDFSKLVRAYNAEVEVYNGAGHDDKRETVLDLCYSSSQPRVIDGIKIRQGCDTGPGDIVLRSFE